MKTQLPNLLGAAIRDYFTDHLPRLRGTSPHTIHSYRDSMVLLLRFLARQRNKPITGLDLTDLDPPGILAFLSHLEQERKNGVSTRNVRLSAIHAFFHFVASRNPEHLELAQRVLGIPFKRARQRAIDYLEYDEIDAILKAIDRTTPQGSRDYALLATMFNTGGRVQEIADLRACDLQLTKPFQVRLFGKGRKERYCPLWPQTAAVLRAFSDQRTLDLRSESRVFLNHRGRPLTRFGIRYILAKCLGLACAECSKSPQETAAPPQRSSQYGRRSPEIGRRPIEHQSSAGACQSDHDEPLCESRPRNEAPGHRQGQAGPPPLPHALGQGPHHP